MALQEITGDGDVPVCGPGPIEVRSPDVDGVEAHRADGGEQLLEPLAEGLKRPEIRVCGPFALAPPFGHVVAYLSGHEVGAHKRYRVHPDPPDAVEPADLGRRCPGCSLPSTSIMHQAAGGKAQRNGRLCSTPYNVVRWTLPHAHLTLLTR